MRTRKPNIDKKEKKEKRQRKHLRFFLCLLVLACIGCAYFYYINVYLSSHEPSVSAKTTTCESTVDFSHQKFFLSLYPDIKEAAFKGKATELDYGTYIIPGLSATETQIYNQKNSSDICSSMTPQGLAVTEDYILVSAYCFTGTHNSVIYVIDKKSHDFVKEIVLRNKAHVGGLAYDPIHQNIWIAGSSNGLPQVNAITLNQLENYNFQDGYTPITYSQSYDLYAINRSSFLTYYDCSLYVGYFAEDTSSVLEEYAITEDGTLATEIPEEPLGTSDSLAPVALPCDVKVITEQAQGVAFYKNKILFSQSYGPFPSSLQVHYNTIQKLLEKDSMIEKVYFPEKMEQIYVDGDDLYVLFESAAHGYHASSLCKIDRILKLDLTKLL
ncbi:MAG: hypothetical protein U0L12_01045 [Ruminococcus sp.]|nr:hypothetical protein [Ruminococcus sp.]